MKNVFLFGAVLCCTTAFAQLPFSINTNISGLRNLTPKQKFWAIGQSIGGELHLSSKETAYAGVEYYRQGKFQNNFTANAKSPLSSPQILPFTAMGTLTFRQFVLGWKHYFKGGFSGTKSVNIYSTAGFGYFFAKATNSASPSFDTARYSSPLLFGQARVRRLTFDAGLGAETHLGGSVYGFATLHAWLPASYQPSAYLHNSERMPLALIAGAGIRVLFDFVY